MPSVSEVLQRGWARHQAGDVPAAERVYRGVLAQQPGHPEALVYLGIALFDQRRFAESVTAYEQAIAARDAFPVAWNNLGNSLRMLGETERAESCFSKALAQRPGYLSALKNRGTLWVWSGEIERGLQWYEEGLRHAPDDAELHRNLGVIYLLLGHCERGWPEYRWRWRMPGLSRPNVSAPRWEGQPLSGRSILLYPEQGRGDAIQFVRVAPLLKAAGATVFLRCSERMMPLFSSVPGIDLLLPVGGVIPPVDFHASLIEVVDVWYQLHGELPTAEKLFDDRGGYLAVPDAMVERWDRWLEQRCSGKRRIGINWQGNPQHHADVYRSIPLEAFRPLAKLPGVQLVSLQFGHGRDQLERCEFADGVLQLPDSLDRGGAFLDTAAVVRTLDGVITSDTAVAHLAGALGLEVNLLLGKVPDWRWLREGQSTPWYPTMRLVRQMELGNWDEVVAEVAQRLTAPQLTEP